MEIGNGLGIVPPVFYFLFTYCFLALHSCILSYIFYVESLLAQKAVGQDQSRASKQKESKKKKTQDEFSWRKQKRDRDSTNANQLPINLHN